MIKGSHTKLISPKHVAIIMDGNNRWTKKHKLKGFKGHEKGIESIQNAVDSAKLFNIKFLTLFSFSSENWSRPKAVGQLILVLSKNYHEIVLSLNFNVINDKNIPNEFVKKIFIKKS